MKDYIESMDLVLDALFAREGRLSEDEAAAMIGRSPRRLRAIFRKQWGKCYRVVQHRVRMEAAERRLRETTLSVTLISTELGYSRLDKFVQAFKRDFAMTPTQYRRIGAENRRNDRSEGLDDRLIDQLRSAQRP